MARDSHGQHNGSIKKKSDPEKYPTARIETQIHRRSKAKAVFPLEAEWQAGAEYPSNLRMPADKMDKHRNAGK